MNVDQIDYYGGKMIQNYAQLYKDLDLDNRIKDIDSQLTEIQTDKNDSDIKPLDQQKTQMVSENGYEGDDYDFYADQPSHHASDDDYMDMVEQRS